MKMLLLTNEYEDTVPSRFLYNSAFQACAVYNAGFFQIWLFVQNVNHNN